MPIKTNLWHAASIRTMSKETSASLGQSWQSKPSYDRESPTNKQHCRIETENTQNASTSNGWRGYGTKVFDKELSNKSISSQPPSASYEILIFMQRVGWDYSRASDIKFSARVCWHFQSRGHTIWILKKINHDLCAWEWFNTDCSSKCFFSK